MSTRRACAAAGLLAAIATAACAGATAGSQAGNAPMPATGQSPAAPKLRLGYTDADVAFMTGMIQHHAQAVLMAGWASSHGAGPSVRRLCERIVVGQGDEIELMARWLRDRGEAPPDPAHQMEAGTHHGHVALMPGMLTPEQLAELDRARGAEFDRLFLTYMIQHHRGALTMVDRLFSSPGAGQDETVFRLASDIQADQSTEIDRMQLMLAALPPASEEAQP